MFSRPALFVGAGLAVAVIAISFMLLDRGDERTKMPAPQNQQEPVASDKDEPTQEQEEIQEEEAAEEAQEITPPFSPPPVQIEPPPQDEPPPNEPTGPQIVSYIVEADDNGLYPATISVPRDATVNLTFKVRSTNVYYGGLDFRSTKFVTSSVPPGGETTVTFTADATFTYTSYWPASGVKKADGTITVQ
ncbi:MAG: hypothetical protein A2806_00925 [Candidatus Terrybacteria bacterium RIFCSPHIGHO2_01_FULL_48_17]|uniref:EfeO-type cupredoxin-like domain-containing protein n=1 Tax=Candidatus Terrybacteria bacterium RIFCSPHIGHO2_01_FULL_48_17 TaxID=1802362 RepID=A0A1G2PK03_9BACT|nr:MAG: hypothetical protein A2806_00925 [Candidatus Terrybacteria bacterium RIFCSPHIGHO2_01_FULL_48_17]OHA51882.1 MAG: hypothetical protein A3A30_00940 [Candidatus Terrybacteria bacterium RIFCSPLOWO2_01_FULL_48_14]